jgi:hypothetical protein
VPGRDHEILARAIAKRLELPLAPWPAIGTPAPGLVVAYDLGTIASPDLARLTQRKDGQLFFAHASPWTRDVPIAPDVTTLLYQSLVQPWETDTRAVEEIAADLLASPGLDAEERTADEPAKWSMLLERAWPPTQGMRARWWAGGPVASNRFE